MEENYKNILAETSFVLKHLDKDMYNKIPADVLELIEKNKSENYIVNYEFNKTLYDQKLNKETFALISILYLKFCVNENERKKLLKICYENDIKEEILLKQKFDTENIFKNKKVRNTKEEQNSINNENKSIILKKEGLIFKVISFIKNILKIK